MGQTLTHHPHVHCIVPGGGLGPDGTWIASKSNFFLPVHVLSRCFRRLFLGRLRAAFDAGRIAFVGELAGLSDLSAFAKYLEPLSKTPWIVFAKRPFAGPSEILDYLGRYTHRVAIANGRLLDCRDGRVSFRREHFRPKTSPRRWRRTPTSSCAAFSCTSCPRASAAFAISAFSPTPAAPRRSPDTRRARLSRTRAARRARGLPRTLRTATGKRIDIRPVRGGRMVDADAWPHRPRHRRPHAVTLHGAETANHASMPDSIDMRPSAPAPGQLAAYSLTTSVSSDEPDRYCRQPAQLREVDPTKHRNRDETRRSRQP